MSRAVPNLPMIGSSDLRAVTAPLRVAVVDDDPITRGELKKLVDAIPGLAVTASVASVQNLDQFGDEFAVVVLSVAEHEAWRAPATITRLAQVTRPLVIATWERPSSLLAAVHAGASGCLTRQCDHQDVALALKTVAMGGLYICEHLMDRFHDELSHPAHAHPYGLAPREVETLRWIARGLTHSQIATRMGLSYETINTYAKRIRTKLKVSNKAELTRKAIELGHLRDEYCPADDRHYAVA